MYILFCSDLVKFAKMKEQEGQAKVDRTVVEDIINETKEIIPEPTQEELLQNQLYLENLRKKELKRKRIKIALGWSNYHYIAKIIHYIYQKANAWSINSIIICN